MLSVRSGEKYFHGSKIIFYHTQILAVEQYLLSITGVKAIHHLHIWGLSTKETALTAHLIVPSEEFSDTHLKVISMNLRKQFTIHHITIQVEKNPKAFPCGLEHPCG